MPWLRFSGNQARGLVYSVAPTNGRRPLAIIPAGNGSSHAYLVVGTQRTSTLHVLQLPHYRLVHTHNLDGVQVVGAVGLAADAVPDHAIRARKFRLDGTGGDILPSELHLQQAIVVMNGVSNDILVLRWPLPGMRPLP